MPNICNFENCNIDKKVFLNILRIYVTKRGTVCLRQLAVIHLVNNFQFLWNPKINYSVHRQSANGPYVS